MSDPNIYTIGWICAISTEYVAAQALLDQIHKPPEHVSQNDNNDYALGSIGRHNVVIAALPDGEYGTSSAAGVARDMLHTFSNIRIGLMVGVGGGAPSPRHDIRLGDIVVSAPRDGKGGVLQYDFGKTIQEQSFQITSVLNQPPTVLRTAISGIQSQHEMNGHRIEDVIQDALENKRRLRNKYSRPDTSKDSLYLAEIIHSDEACCTGAASTDPSNLVRRRPRTEDDDNPTIHYGLIASANTLMKDALVRDRLSSEKDVLCFEMEAAGLMNHFPCVVIRGICDYSDTHKNKEWQGYAAMAAAAYAKDLLCRIAPNKIEAERKVIEAINDVSEKLTGVHLLASDLKTQSYLDKLQRWLSPPDPSTNFNKALEQRHQGSGKWLLKREEYTAWKNEPNSFLWIYGIPGCGKTILSATVVEDLTMSKTCLQALLYFFFDFSQTTKEIFENAVRSLILQLYFKSAPAQKHLDSLYTTDCKGGNSQPSIESLREIFTNMAEEVGEVWIVIDALDECRAKNEQQLLLKWIKDLRRSQTNVHLLATSRPEPEIQFTIEEISRQQDTIRILIQSDLVKKDISAYVRAKVEKSPQLRKWKSNPTVQREIENTLIEKANGMQVFRYTLLFRWVTCQFDELEDCIDPPAVRRVLASLPKTLDETYARILTNIPKTYERYTRRILQFLLFSERPLTINEFVDAVAVDTKNGLFDPKNRMPNPREIPKCCSSLVVVVITDDSQELIQLAHFSVKEYLVSNLVKENIAPYLKPVAASTSIAEVCLIYLLQLHGLPSENFFLARYAAEYWMRHATAAERHSETVRTLATKFFSSRGAYKACIELYDPTGVYLRWYSLPPTLYYASYAGLFFITKMLLENGADHHKGGRSRHWSALHAASKIGHERIVRMLLNKGADVNAKTLSETALYTASENGHERIVQILLEKGADVDAKGSYSVTPLYIASYRGYDGIVKMLLEKGADVNIKGGLFTTALHAASTRGYVIIVQMLLEKGAVADAQDEHSDCSCSTTDSESDQIKMTHANIIECKAKGETTSTSEEVPNEVSQGAVSSTTPILTALPTPRGNLVAAESTGKQPQRPSNQSTPDSTTLVPISSVASNSKRKRESDQAYHYEPQNSRESGEPGVKRRRTDEDT